MNKITFISLENGYTSGAEADKYNICYTVMMKDTETNNIINLIEYAVAFLLIAGIPEKEISITLSQGKCWQFSTTTAETLPEATEFETEILKSCYNYHVKGTASQLWNPETNRAELLEKSKIRI